MDKNFIREYGKLETTNWWFQIRQKIILQTIRRFIPKGKSTGLKILNVGAATGASSRWLSALGEVVSVEYDPLFLEYLTAQGIPATSASITALPFAANSFDLVCAFDVVEHVEDDKKAMLELARVCKPGGNVCITVPAFQSLWSNHDVINEHYRRYTKKTYQNIIERDVLLTLYSSYFNSILFPPIFLVRKITGLFKNKLSNKQSDFVYIPTNAFVNNTLKIIFGIEPYLLKLMRFPFGVSIIFLFEKKSDL